MTRTETGACRRMLHNISRQLDEGREPGLVLDGTRVYCGKLELADRLLPALVLAWLEAGHDQGRDLLQMVADAEHLTQIFTEEGATA